MIYRFIIISDEVDDFMREIQLDSDATFLDFHNAILKSCNYANDQMTSFAICENGWEKCQEINLEDISSSSYDRDSYLMENTHLIDFLEDEKQHLLYTFDPLGDRVFFIELSEIITGKSLKEAKITRSEGKAPQQAIDFEEFFARNNGSTSGNNAYDDDDLFNQEGIEAEDLDGLDISDNELY